MENYRRDRENDNRREGWLDEGKLPSSDERSLQEVCSNYNVDETTCEVIYSTLNSSMQKAKKKCKKKEHSSAYHLEKDVKALTKKQLKMYLNQKGVKMSGSKVEWIDRVLAHAMREP